jgi:hypothetical protein
MVLHALALKLKREARDDFRGRHFEATLIVQAVSWGACRFFQGLNVCGTPLAAARNHLLDRLATMNKPGPRVGAVDPYDGSVTVRAE